MRSVDTPLTLAALTLALGCAGSAADPSPPPSAAPTSPPGAPPSMPEPPGASAPSTRCTSSVGTWSPSVDGLRGRLIVVSSDESDPPSVRVDLELENTSDRALGVHWSGSALAFATFRMFLGEGGEEVPEPDWALGGSEMTGAMRQSIAPGAIARHPVGRTMGSAPRIFRIGAFWAREMPWRDGPRFFLEGQVRGAAPSTEPTVTVLETTTDAEASSTRAGPPTDPAERVWLGTLVLEPVCVE
jgi:hypothetical protein